MPNHVLIVDDDESIRTLIASIVEGMELLPVVAANGVDALVQFQRVGGEHFTAAVIDLSMPQMNGRELVSFIRLSAPHVVTILCSGLPELISATPGVGGNGFHATIRKPFTVDEFKARFLRTLMDA